MLEKALRLLTITVLSLAALPTHGVPMPHTYELQASGFSNGSSLIFPYDPLNMAITVTFDPSFSSGTTPVDAFASPLGPTYGPFLFRYDVTTIPKLMTIGDKCLGAPPCSFTLSVDDLIIRLDFSDPDNPDFYDMVIRATGTYPTGGTGVGDFRPTTRAITVVDGSTVPEPGSLSLLGIALLLGFWFWSQARASAPDAPSCRSS